MTTTFKWKEVTGAFPLRNHCSSKYELDNFIKGYTRYAGTGNHLTLYINDEINDLLKDKCLRICEQRVSLEIMRTQLVEILTSFRLIVVDVEMCGIHVVGDKEYHDNI